MTTEFVLVTRMRRSLGSRCAGVRVGEEWAVVHVRVAVEVDPHCRDLCMLRGEGSGSFEVGGFGM